LAIDRWNTDASGNRLMVGAMAETAEAQPGLSGLG